MVNTEPCSMGGIIDYSVSVGTKSSPRSVAIEKAQEELRQEYDVREERRRELEFLEKGGNPLEFKFVHVASVSLQFTSLTDQIAEQNVISEAKGNFPFAASPRGDSVESSAKPGSSLCRETNTADNLMLFGGDNNGAVEEKLVKRGTKRTNAAQPKQSSDRHSNAKKSEDSGSSRLGVKSQAYVRRNRSKPSRESANAASIRSPMVPAKGSELKDAKGAIQEKQADDHGEPKQAGPKCDNVPKNTASDEQVAMELDGIQTIYGCHCIVKGKTRQNDNNNKATEAEPYNASDNQQFDGCGEIAAAGASLEIPKVVARSSYSNASTHDEGETCADDEKVEDGHLDKSISHIHVGESDNCSIVSVCAVEGATLHKNAVDPPCDDRTSIIDNHADGNSNLVAMKIDGKSHENLGISRISNKGVKESGQLEGVSRSTSVKENSNSVLPEACITVHVKDEMEVCDNIIVAQKDTSCPSASHSMNNEGSPALERINSCPGDSSAHPIHIAVGSALPKNPLPDSTPLLKTYGSNAESEIKKSGDNLKKMANKEYEDSILRKACLIEVSLRRAGERSVCNMSLEKRRKGHWGFVLEEMAWMANDFMQERMWKSMAASQVCRWIASDGLAKFDEANIQRKQKSVIRSLAKGIMFFWHSAEALRTMGGTAKMMQEHDSNILEETDSTGIKAEKEHGNESMEAEESMLPRRSQVQDYAVRFLEHNSHASDSLALAEAPPTPDRLNDFGILKVSDQLLQDNLFYNVAPGAMSAYRESVESLFMYHKKVGNIEPKDEYEASVCDSAADLAQENAYEEDEDETCTYLLPEAYGGGLLSKMGHGHKKKYLVQQRINGARPYEIGTDVPYELCLDSKSGNRPLFSNGKRPSSFLAIPTKRIRTASRQRVVSPFPASAGGTPQVTSKTDVSSGDTNSYQDDQSSLHGGSLPWNMDYESTVDFDRQLPYNGSEVWSKANKKKKLKNPGYKTVPIAANSFASAAVKGRMYDQRSQVDLITQYEQKDYLKKRSEAQQFYSNGNIAANGGQHASKKLKMMKQGMDVSQEASPIASQMSNMANPAKIIKIITNRDRGRKGKALKMASSGGWSNFEDQALVVLVHDMGQNWELVSDAINSIVQFKSVYRQPKECKERHKVLVDKSSGDGADSAEDSGSSQHYHFTIPGIPKGSARQLFQRLQGPFEEENLKSHFEKMIPLMQQMQSRRRQGNSQETKPIIQPHSSHVVALSQACPNNLSGGTLTPLDLCDAISSNLDAVTPGSGYQGSHTNGLTLPNHHGSVGPTTTTSNLNSRLPGSPSNLPSPSTLSTPSRDAQKFGTSRSTSLQGDEQQKIQYNQSGRNLQQPGGSATITFPAGIDRSARMMPGANGMGMMTGLNRGMPAARAGFPRVSSPGMLNMVPSGNMLPNSGQGVPNAVNVHSGATPAPVNLILRPRDPMQILRPGQKEEHRQMVMPEFHIQVSQGSSQAVHSSSMNPSFSNAATSSSVQQTQQPHQISQPSHMFGNPRHSQIQGTSNSSPQQQAYVLRLAKERQIQQHMVPQQHNELSGSSARVQNGSQIRQQNQTPAATLAPSSQPQHQHQQSAQNPPHNSALPNQPANATQHKQKKQQGQQQPRQNQQQRNQGSQQAKLMKSLGRGNMLIPQHSPVDSTPASVVSTPSKKQLPDKNPIQHAQGFSPGNKSSTSSVPVNQHKQHTSLLAQSPKQLPDIGDQGLMQGSPSHTLLASQQPPLHSKSPMTMQQLQQRQINPSQNTIHRMMMQQNLQMNSDCMTDSQIEVQHNQLISTTPMPQGTEPASPGILSINQQKHEASHDPTAVTSTSNLLSSPKDNFIRTETSLPSSSQAVLQMQVSGGLPIHGQVIGGQWHQ